jgi:membrane-bound lytic murein transglycosylase B
VKKPTKGTAALAALGVTGAAAALGVALIGSPAQAEDPTPSPSASASTPPKPDRAAERAQRQDELAAALATELGIDKAKVAAALEKVQADRKGQGRDASRTPETQADRIARLKTRLDEAVKAGKLTAEESAAILKAAEAGVLPAGGGPRGGRPGR